MTYSNSLIVEFYRDAILPQRDVSQPYTPQLASDSSTESEIQDNILIADNIIGVNQLRWLGNKVTTDDLWHDSGAKLKAW